MNKRGLTDQIMIVVIIFLVFIGMMGIYFIVAIAGPILQGQGQSLASTFRTEVHRSDPGSALDNASMVATDTASGMLGIMEAVSYMFLVAMLISYLLIAYYVRTYPFLAVVWIFIIAAMTLFGMILSNAYQEASSNPELENFYLTWGANDYIMNYLPQFVIVLGILGGILLFVLIAREPETEVWGLN